MGSRACAEPKPPPPGVITAQIARHDRRAAQLAAAFDGHGARCTGLPTGTTARREVDAVEGCQQLEGLADAAFDFDNLAEAAAHATGAAGTRA